MKGKNLLVKTMVVMVIVGSLFCSNNVAKADTVNVEEKARDITIDNVDDFLIPNEDGLVYVYNHKELDKIAKAWTKLDSDEIMYYGKIQKLNFNMSYLNGFSKKGCNRVKFYVTCLEGVNIVLLEKTVDFYVMDINAK